MTVIQIDVVTLNRNWFKRRLNLGLSRPWTSGVTLRAKQRAVALGYSPGMPWGVGNTSAKLTNDLQTILFDSGGLYLVLLCGYFYKKFAKC